MSRKSLSRTIFSTILIVLITPLVFGQHEARSGDENPVPTPSATDAAAPEADSKPKDNKNVIDFQSTQKFVSSAPVPDSGMPPSPPTGTSAQQESPEDAAALAKKLSNPVSSLISLPIQSNFDFGMGPNGDGFRQTLNVQPVIPITLNKDWNLISRTIVPIIGQSNVVADGSSQFGLGDITQAFFFSPNKTEPIIWAIGPQLMIPTATNQYLGSKKLSLGPTFLILKQQGPWSVGALTGHFWSVAGSDSRPSVNLTNFQPFVSYSTKSAWTFTVNAESTYDWHGKQWNVPLHFGVAKLVRFGKQPVSIGGTLRCWTASGPNGPEGCGFRFTVTPLFPRKG